MKKSPGPSERVALLTKNPDISAWAEFPYHNNNTEKD